MIFNFTFEDFQRMLAENKAKPIYSVQNNQYELFWTIGGFIYQTVVTFDEILKGYIEETGKKDADLKSATGAFHEKYLKDCFQHHPELKTEKIKPIVPQLEPLRAEDKPETHWHYTPVGEISNFNKDSLWIEKENQTKKTIKGITKQDAVAVLGTLELHTDSIHSADSSKAKKIIKKSQDELIRAVK